MDGSASLLSWLPARTRSASRPARGSPRQDRETFFPEVTLAFTVTADEHHHVALLLSPFAYTTYRGS